MIESSLLAEIIKIFFICIIITAACIISSRNLLSVVSAYALQSLTIVLIAISLYLMEGSGVILAIATVTFISKVLIIPYFITTIQEKIRIKRDIQFHFLSPTTSLIISIGLMLLVYIALSRIMAAFPARDTLFFFGSVLGISLMLMGMMVTFSRKRALTKVLGFLSMENGVLLFGLFVTELPFIIEFLIVIDLIILVLLTTILTVGLDSTLEDYHRRLHRFHLVEEPEGTK